MLYRRILKRDNYKCGRCENTQSLEVDHILPRALGGGNTKENLQTLCASCHVIKTRWDMQQIINIRRYGGEYKPIPNFFANVMLYKPKNVIINAQSTSPEEVKKLFELMKLVTEHHDAQIVANTKLSDKLREQLEGANWNREPGFLRRLWRRIW